MTDLLGEPSRKQLISMSQSDARINIWVGAVRSGKTYISIWRFLNFVSQGPPGEYVMLAKTYRSFGEYIIPQINQIIGSDFEYYRGYQKIVLYGKNIHLIGANDERAEGKIRGATFSGAYVDELTILPESVFKMLISRCAMLGAKIFATTNPDSPFHWVKRDFLDNNPDVKTWLFTLDDNPALNEATKDYLKRQYKGLWFQRFIEGRWVQAEGSIYDQFNEEYHVIENPPAWNAEYIVGIDYGTTNPCAFVLLGHDPLQSPNLWIEAEYYFDSKTQQRQKTDAEYADDLEAFIAGRNIRGMYLDPSAVSFRIELHKRGIPKILEANNDVLDGIRFVNNYLVMGKLKVCGHCKHVIREFQSYVWDEKSQKLGVDRPKKENDHALDALRYAIYTHFKEQRGGGMTAQQLDEGYMKAIGIQPNVPRFFRNDQMNGF